MVCIELYRYLSKARHLCCSPWGKVGKCLDAELVKLVHPVELVEWILLCGVVRHFECWQPYVSTLGSGAVGGSER